LPPSFPGGQWECLADAGWVAYDAEPAAKLAGAAAAGLATVTYSARGQKYKCDLAQMTQTNTYTNAVRQMRCVGNSAGGGAKSWSGGGNGNGGSSGGGSSPAAVPASCVESNLPGGGFLLRYAMGVGGEACEAVTAWNVLRSGIDYDPHACCPITAEPLGDGACVVIAF
jgi:hypothetical protein